jgi:predicted DCC family thiol-disulfide oxidoreductase YuxK
VNAERTENSGRRGLVFYDADCPLCQAGVKRLGQTFTRRGFEWQPLQTPGLADRLGLSGTALQDEMKLQLADGRVVGGVDAWVCLFRSVWWLWPVGAVLSLPGFHVLGQFGYRWVAQNRHCLGGKCAASQHGRPRRVIPFLDLP